MSTKKLQRAVEIHVSYLYRQQGEYQQGPVQQWNRAAMAVCKICNMVQKVAIGGYFVFSPDFLTLSIKKLVNLLC